MIQVLRPRARRSSPWSTIGATKTKKNWTRKRKVRSPQPGGLRALQTKKKFPRPKPRNRKAVRTIGAWADSKSPTNREARDGNRRKKLQHLWKPSLQRQAVESQ